MDQHGFVTAREAAAELNISRATLYAYVSRGLIESVARPGERSRRYALADIRALRRDRGAADGGSETRPTPRGMLDFGTPVLESRLTTIWEDRLFYRGRDALALAEAASFETVAGLLWDNADTGLFDAVRQDVTGLAPVGPPGIAAAMQGLAVAAMRDPRAHGRRPEAMARTGAVITQVIARAFGAGGSGPLDQALANGWGRPEAVPAIRAALILAADHELNASTFVVRCVASTRATLYNAVIAGLAALQGPRHGGQTLQVAAFLDEAGRAISPEQAVADRLARGEPLPGFGHPLYASGDARARGILNAVDKAGGDAAMTGFARRIAAAALDMTGEAPNIDFALVTLARAFGLPDHAPMGLFATGRSVGWIAHALEQYGDGRLIRPRARYVGEEPRPSHANRAP